MTTGQDLLSHLNLLSEVTREFVHRDFCELCGRLILNAVDNKRLYSLSVGPHIALDERHTHENT